MIAFHILGLSVYWYGIFYLIAFVFAYLFFFVIRKNVLVKEASAPVYSLLNKSLDDLFLGLILGVLVGGRLGHVLIYDLSYYLQNPLHIFYLGEGGMSFIGGIIGVVAALLIITHKYKFKKSDFLLLADLVILPATFGIMLGRIGNFLNQELYGRVVFEIWPNISNGIVEFFSNIGIFYVYKSIDSFLRVNTNILSSLFEGLFILGFSIVSYLCFIKKKRIRIGFLSSCFLILYSFFRFMFEYLREDSQMEFVGIFTKSQRFFLVFLLVGLILLFVSQKKSK